MALRGLSWSPAKIGLSVPTGWSLSQEITQKMNRIIINQYQPPTVARKDQLGILLRYHVPIFVATPLVVKPGNLKSHMFNGTSSANGCLKIGHPKNQKKCGWLLIVFQFKSALGDFTPFSYRPNIILILFVI